MRFAAHALGLLALGSTALATTYDFFLVKATTAAGETGKAALDDTFLYNYVVSTDYNYPLLAKEKDGAGFFYLAESVERDGVQYYSLENNATNKGPIYHLDIVDLSADTVWQPFMFYDTTATTAIQGGFYLDDGKLLYTTDTKNASLNAFQGWLACEWWIGYPQLFYLTDAAPADYTPIKTCAKIDLKRIPLV